MDSEKSKLDKTILVVASTFPASNTDPVPAFVKDQVIALKRRYLNLTMIVLCPHDKGSNTKSFTRHEHYDEYRFHYFWPFAAEKLVGRGIMPALKANPLKYLLIPFLFFAEFWALLMLARRLKPDVIYAHWFTPQAIIARWVGVFTRTPFVFTTHAADVDVWNKIPVIGPRIVRSNALSARAITAVSTRSMNKLERFFSQEQWAILREKAAIIPMGVSLPDALYSGNGLAKKQKAILFVGRLAEKKGVQYLLPAFAQAQPQLADYRLIIAGDGPWLQRLQKQAAELELNDSVSFPGFVSGNDKSSLINSADIYAVPSIITSSGDAEGLPVSLMEGLAYGKICIASNESGADDILTDGSDGILVPQKDVDALANALVQAAHLDAQQKAAVQKAAQHTARQFDWTLIAQKHYDFLFKESEK